MTYLKTVAGALAIMAASGMIADFELSGTDDDIRVRVWSFDAQPDSGLRKQVAVLLSRHVGEDRIVLVTPDGV